MMKVPVVIVRKPSALAPCTVKVPVPGSKSRYGVADVPLLSVTPAADFRFVLPLPVQKASTPAFVKVMPTCEVSVFWLKSMVPLFVRFPARERACVVIAPAGFAWKIPPLATVTSLPTVRVLATAASYCSVPPPATVTDSAAAAVSIVTVQPFVIVTTSAAVGTTPPTHGVVELQLPPGVAQEMLSSGLVELPNVRLARRSAMLGKVGEAPREEWRGA